MITQTTQMIGSEIADEVFKNIMGYDIVDFLSYAFFACVGIAFTLLAGTLLRDKASVDSPSDFSYSYLIWDNAKRILLSIIAVAVSIRFAPELFGFDMSFFKAFAIGASFDGLALIIKQKTTLLDPKKPSE